MLQEKKLSSGAVLKYHLSSFDNGNELFQAVTSELKDLRIHGNQEIDHDFIKNMACAAVSSKKIQAALWACFDKCLYNGAPITKATFEPKDARSDYLEVCKIVAWENLEPFTKSLYSEFATLLGQVIPAQE